MKKWEKKGIQHYIGYLGERDEYQQTKIYEVLAVNNMLTFYLLTIFITISFIWDVIHQQFTLGTFALFIIQQFNSGYIMFQLRKYNVLQTEFYDKKSFTTAVNNMKLKAVFAGLEWGFFMLVTNGYILPALLNEPINVNLFTIIVWAVAGCFFGLSMYFFGKKRLRLMD